MTSSDNDSLKPPELTDKAIYGFDGQTVLPIAVSNVECLRRETSLLVPPRSINGYVSGALFVQIKDSSDPIQISPRIEDESYWDEVHEFALKKGISYEVRIDSDPCPEKQSDVLIWESETPFLTPKRVKRDEFVTPKSFSARHLLLYKEYRCKPLTTERIELFKYTFGCPVFSQFYPSRLYGPELDPKFAGNVIKLIPSLTKKKLKELFSPEKKED